MFKYIIRNAIDSHSIIKICIAIELLDNKNSFANDISLSMKFFDILKPINLGNIYLVMKYVRDVNNKLRMKNVLTRLIENLKRF